MMGLDVSAGAKDNNSIEDKVLDQSLKKKKTGAIRIRNLLFSVSRYARLKDYNLLEKL